MNGTDTIYTAEFYDGQKESSFQSAKVILPVVLNILGNRKIKSAVDFGCGVGTWLAVFQSIVPDAEVMGMDGGAAEESQFFIPQKCFEKTDVSQSVFLKKKYDICFSLEVAEHVPEEQRDAYVNNLCRSSDIILFSAALKGQGGTGHVNEQPLSYWIDVFGKAGYDYIDGIRTSIWNNEKVSYWYKQNIVLFVRRGTMDMDDCRSRCQAMPVVDVVHPLAIQTSLRDTRNIIEERDRHIINKNAIKKKFPNVYTGLRKIKRMIKK